MQVCLLILECHWFQALSANRAREYMCVYPCIDTYLEIILHVTTCVYIKWEFLLISPSWIHYHRDHSSQSPLLTVTSHSISEKHWWLLPSVVHLVNCLVLVCVYSHFIIANLWPHGKQSYQLEHSAQVQCSSFLPLVLQIPLIFKVTWVSTLFLHLPWWGYSIHLYHSYIVLSPSAFHLEISNLLDDYKKFCIH